MIRQSVPVFRVVVDQTLREPVFFVSSLYLEQGPKVRAWECVVRLPLTHPSQFCLQSILFWYQSLLFGALVSTDSGTLPFSSLADHRLHERRKTAQLVSPY